MLLATRSFFFDPSDEFLLIFQHLLGDGDYLLDCSVSIIKFYEHMIVPENTGFFLQLS